MKIDVHTLLGEVDHQIELQDSVFSREPSLGSIYHAVRHELANRRVGTASTRTRSQVSGSDRKPWRQKGLGRARAGTRRSPLWKGGGIIFGPQPRDYSYRLPRKIRSLAMQSLLSQKLRDEALLIVEDFTIETGKTKDFVQRINPIFKGEKPERVVLIMKDNDAMVKRSASNLPWLSYLNYLRLSAHSLFYARRVIVMESAAKELSAFYTGETNGS